MTDRYGLYGLIPTEREANERPMSLSEQSVGDSGDELIYETNDRNEARAIYEAGGFERGGVWHVVTRMEDRSKQQSMRKPPLTRALSDKKTVTDGPALSKRDYDQS